MKKSIIYVDFILRRKKVNYMNFLVIKKTFFFLKYFKGLTFKKETLSKIDTEIKVVQ